MDSCNLDVIGKDYKNFLIKNDLIIFPVISSELGTSVAAAARACLTHPDTNRPIIGIVYISRIMDEFKKNWKNKIKNTLFHEITHILGFSYNFFSDLNMVIKEGNIYYINSPKVLEQAKKYFGCDNLPYPGVPLENQGGEGSARSHWEGRYIYGDYMNMEISSDTAISDITLALLEDTGFYKVNYFSGGLFKFGKNKGCEFFTKKCIENDKANFGEFCDLPKELKCTSSLTSKSSCYMHNYNFNIPYQYFSNTTLGGIYFTNFCPVTYEYGSTTDNSPKHCQLGTSNLTQEYGEILGKESLCFISSLLPDNSQNNNNSKIPICYGVQCDSKKRQIIIKIGSKNVICPEQGGEINNPSGFKGILECPKYEEICSNNDDFICNEIFSCLDEAVKKNSYNYITEYYDYEGPSVAFGDDDYDVDTYTNDEDDKDDEDDDNGIGIIRPYNSYNIKLYSAFWLACLIILIC